MNRIAATAASLCLLAWSLLTISCQDNSTTPPDINPEFRQYISAFTSGVISKSDHIRIRLATPHPHAVPGGEVDDDLFSFSPRIKGSATWIDEQTIDYAPEKPLESGKIFNAKFYLSKLVKVPSHLETFVFQFQTMKQYMSVVVGAIGNYPDLGMTRMKVTGTASTADYLDSNAVPKVLRAEQDGKSLPVRWVHQQDGLHHQFQVDSIVRSENTSRVIISWDGDRANLEGKGADTIDIPSLKDFKLVRFNVYQDPEQYVSLQFSDPLKQDQELDGLITIDNNGGLRYVIDGNEVKIYTETRLGGVHKMSVMAGIKNELDYRLLAGQVLEMQFEGIRPQVRLVGNGTVLPNSEGLLFPFDAISLKAVDVTIVQIFENNIGQFLQVNNLDGNQELKRVARPVLHKTVSLEGKGQSLYTWNTYYLDLGELIEAEPGAIYNVEIGFHLENSLYGCQDDTTKDVDDIADTWDLQQQENDKYWDNAYSYYYNDYGYYPTGYRYQDRDNPCTVSYYGRRRSVNRNILASDLGLIAKGGNGKEMLFAVTNMVTTKPMANVDVDVYNYQNQVIATGKTDDEGLVSVELKGKPFLLIARDGKQRGYLRLDDGNSLSFSKFDISGQHLNKGIKGYIYGERGVWRPGDSLYVMFVLEDKQDVLPPNHPVVFEMYDPRGQLVQRKVSTAGLNGMYNFSTRTEDDAPTGNWRVSVRVGGSTFYKTLKIETVKPNRLKLNLDFGDKLITVKDGKVNGTLQVNWLHGAPARNLRSKILVTLNQMNTRFDDYKDYEFDDPSRGFHSDEETVFDGKVDSKGHADITAKLNPGKTSPGMLRASFVVRAFEEGGDFSIDRFSIPYAPFESFVGVKVPKGDYRGTLRTDTIHTIDIVTVDPQGKPVDRNNLEVSVYKVGWRWWWEYGYGDLSSYNGTNYHNRVAHDTVSTHNGHATYDLRINYPNWGRYLVRVCDKESGHCTGQVVYIDWPSWVGKTRKDNPGGATMLVFSSDKGEYKVGDDAEITFPSSGVGRALVTVESGSKVISAQWVEAQKDQTRFKIRITDEMSPNVYVNITLVQPHAQTANDLPIRMYGVIPISVVDPNTKLKPVIDMPEVLKPEEPVTIKVSEANGKKMTYTIAVVDEGLLDLTRFETPNPWSTFYAREALGVRTWDIYNYVMGAFGGQLKALLSLGGGDDAKANENKSARRFKPVVQFMGPFELKIGETATHTFTMPNYVGSVRTMVVAAEDGAYGSADKTTPVRKPLMVLATLPRVLGPGEVVKLPVTVFAMEDKVKNVTVKVRSEGPLQLTGGGEQQVTFDKVGDQVIYFDMKVDKMTGIGKVFVEVSGAGETASTSIELNVRNPNPPVVDYQDLVLEPGKKWSPTYTPIGISGTNSGVLEVSNMPPIDLGRRLQYLLQYPHGCIEQTTSSVFPQLYLADIMVMDAAAKVMAQDNVRAGLNRLRSFQRSDGGFSYWPGTGTSNNWGSTYAGHFMLEAELKGYQLPVGMKEGWIKYQRTEARNWSPYKDGGDYMQDYSIYAQAYRLYTLALAKAPEMGAMNRLREMTNISPEAKFRLAAAYALAGQMETAKELLKDIPFDLPLRSYDYYSYSYGSALRDEAMMLETMLLLGDNVNAFKVVKHISERLNSNSWYSTQTTAYCLLAASKYARKFATGGDLKFSYSINGAPTQSFASSLPVSQIDLGITGTKGGKLTVENTTQGVLYARVTLQGVPIAGDTVSKHSNIKMRVVFRDMRDSIIDVSRLTQGTDFMAEVTIENEANIQYYRDLALSQIFPSGWEIHNTRMDASNNVHLANTSVPVYQDIRDDRVYTYYNLPTKGARTYRILLNASYQGKFYLPTTYTEAMYDNTVFARKAGQWIQVVKPGE